MIKFFDLLKEIQENPTYSYDFIEIIAIWLNFGIQNKKNTESLLKLNIPSKFKKCNEPIYRILALDNDEKIRPGIGSWTTDLEMAKKFIYEFWFEDSLDNKEKAVIYMIPKPKPKNIILNISLLFNDEQFNEDIEYYENNKKFFNEGLMIGDSQSEIIYNDQNESIPYLELKNKKWVKINNT